MKKRILLMIRRYKAEEKEAAKNVILCCKKHQYSEAQNWQTRAVELEGCRIDLEQLVR